jgi:hypothetical protein
MALRLPNYPSKASGAWFALNAAVPLFWVLYRDPLKIKEMERELAL